MDSGVKCVKEVDDADKQLVESVKPLLCEIREPFPQSGIEKTLIHSLLDRPVKADKNSLLSAKEICILCKDVKVEDEDTLVMSTGYFFGAYFRRDIKLPEDAELNAEMLACLRHHGIYVR